MGLIEEALVFAIEAHKNTFRKYDNTPYIRHPMAVMGIMTLITTEEAALAAALLHDTVEDCEDITLEVLHERFGEIVAGYVFYCTEKSKKTDGNRSIRKEIDRRHYSSGCSASHNIKIADMIDNIPGIVFNDPIFSKTYMYEKIQLLGMLQKADIRLQKIALKLIADMFTKIN
jgi:guanosine-3',5'-bis(diphosphate) 3'-pyrophosphohydrolase